MVFSFKLIINKVKNKPTACQKKKKKNSLTQAPSAATDAQITPGMGKRAHDFGGCSFFLFVAVFFACFPCFFLIFQGVQDPGLCLERNSVMAETTAFVLLGVKASTVLAPLRQNQV